MDTLKQLTPDEMSKFLNGLATQVQDYETKDKLIQCSLYIHSINQALEGLRNRPM